MKPALTATQPRPSRRWVWAAALLSLALAGLLLSRPVLDLYSTREHETNAAKFYFTGPARLAALACQHNSAAEMSLVLTLTQINPNAPGRNGMTLLLLAVRYGSEQAVAALLRHGADPNLLTQTEGIASQPVGLAAGLDSLVVLRVLLDHGANPNARLGEESAAFRAFYTRHYAQLRLLLKRGADAKVASPVGESMRTQLADSVSWEEPTRALP